MPDWLIVGAWGLAAGSALVLGAAVGFFVDLSHRVIAGVMGFGGGVLISVMSVELMEKARHSGSLWATGGAFLGGAVLFSGVNYLLSGYGAQHRKRCGGCVRQPIEAAVGGSGLAIAVGALLDGIPESLVIGLSAVGGHPVSMVVVVGFFLANVPEGLSATAGMKQAGRSAAYIFGIWTGIALLSGVAATTGFLVLGRSPPAVAGAIGAFAAGGVLAMLAETMIPEAFADAQHFIGVITVSGFLAAFLLASFG